MPTFLLDHYSVRATDIAQTTRFYTDTLGFVAGPRPAFDFPGAWLYNATAEGGVSGNALVHIIGVAPDSAQGLSDYLGDRQDAGRGTGVLDHIAFAAQDAPAMRARLQARAIAYRERAVPGLGLVQIFLQDPNGVTLELNYPA